MRLVMLIEDNTPVSTHRHAVGGKARRSSKSNCEAMASSQMQLMTEHLARFRALDRGE